MPEPVEHALILPDGRRTTLLILGPPNGLPVIALHGTPGSRLKFLGAAETAHAAGVRLIAPDRWGYAGTDAPKQPALADYGSDISAIADSLGLARFALLGVSGGGPFAAAVACTLGVRITRLALVCPVGPMAGREARDASPFHRFCFRILPRLPGAVGATFSAYRTMLAIAPDIAIRAAMVKAPPADHLIMADRAARLRLARAFQVGLQSGTSGPRTDMALFSRPWGLNMPASAEVRVWVGSADRNIPVIAAHRLAIELAATLVERKNDGHYWIDAAYHELFRWLGGR